MRPHYLQHVPFEGLGSIQHWLDQQKWQVSSTQLYRDNRLPDHDDYDWLIVLGGPMSVNDEGEHPWLVSEKRFIADAIERDKTILGICLGAQLIANVLDAEVHPNSEREIGWFPVERCELASDHDARQFLPPKIEAFHWHGETFDLPKGSVHLARSSACENQAFSYGDRVLGLQFHLETTPTAAAALIENCANELGEGRYVESPEAMLSCVERFKQINRVMSNILDQMQGLAG